MKNKNSTNLPIAVFDSGVGGLTVLRALQQELPEESFLYLGDTARLPYGTKSPTTIINYALHASRMLIAQNIKLLVVACNTATTLALPVLKKNFLTLPIIGTLEPGAQAACTASRNGCIAVIATEATVNAQGYQNTIKQIRPQAQVIARSCGLFVALAEEGWVTGPIAELTAKHYLDPLFDQSPRPDCLLLGCTHFPVMANTIQKIIGKDIHLIDSATATALAVKNILQERELLNQQSYLPEDIKFFVTDSPERFVRIAQQFLDIPINPAQVCLVDTQYN